MKRPPPDIAQRTNDPLGELIVAQAERQPTCGDAPSDAHLITPASRERVRPLSFPQQGLWFLEQLDGSVQASHAVAGGIRMAGTLDVPALEAALHRIVARHEALRTTFAWPAGMPVQVVAPPSVGMALVQVDLSAHAEPKSEAQRIAIEEAKASFDLERGPLIRSRLLRLRVHDHLLLVTLHLIVADRRSVRVFIRELRALYTAFTQGQPDPLPPLAMQYGDYTAWQLSGLAGDSQASQLDFWHAQLSGAPERLELRTDRPCPPVHDHVGASLEFELNAGLSAELRALSKRHGTTLFMTLLAGWAALLASLTGQDDLVIGTNVDNRTHAEHEALIGLLANMLALRIDLSANPTVAELLAQVRATTLAAYQHRNIPFQHVVQALNRKRRPSPLFQVTFDWLDAPMDTFELPGLQVQLVNTCFTAVQFDLEISIHEAGECIGGSLCYATALFDASTIEHFLAVWRALLRVMVDDDTARMPHVLLLNLLKNVG